MLWFARPGLRVLMYHRVSIDVVDGLTITVRQLVNQLRWLRGQGFAFVTLPEVLEAVNGGRLPAWPVLVTFDDAYLDTFTLAHPVLAAENVPSTLFVPSAFVGGASSWDTAPQPLMSAEQLRILAVAGWSMALHSHGHRNFAGLAPEAAAAEVRENFAALREWGLEPVPVLAFPYGGRPRGLTERAAMNHALSNAGVRLACRIGNRVNRLPIADRFEVNRLGIRGDVSFQAFQRKVWWGRLI